MRHVAFEERFQKRCHTVWAGSLQRFLRSAGGTVSARGLIVAAMLVFAPGESVRAADVSELLARPIIDPELSADEIREFTQSRILPMPDVKSVAAWEDYAERMRKETLERVVFRGEAARWREYKGSVEWLETLDGGPGYHIRKLRYEALPGLWIPAVLYEPDTLEGKVPVIMNVNGHDAKGKSTPYKQLRCINQVKRGMIALNVEWLGMGQLRGDDYVHYRMNQIDLCGTSGLAPFYLSMERGLDLLLEHKHADPDRVAVAGLSGGGWQTIIISSLDPRVTLSNPVAGYSSFYTRADEPSDLGDSEQTPVDLATTTDYAQLTALRAPRPTLLTYNAEDNCCFKAEHALPPLIEAAQPIFALYGKESRLRSHVNHDPGTHNFDLDNRQQFYRMLGDFFYPEHAEFDAAEIPSDDELLTFEQLEVDVPSDNASFHSLAVSLMENLPQDAALPNDAAAAKRWRDRRTRALRDVVRARKYHVQAIRNGGEVADGVNATFWRLRIGGDWTVPAVELAKEGADDNSPTVVVVSENGRKSLSKDVERLLDGNHRVLALDPFYFGESKIKGRDFLMGLLLSAVGDRPLGVQTSQLASIARWLKHERPGSPVIVRSSGPRSSLFVLIAAALEQQAIDRIELSGSFGSLKEIIEQNKSVQEAPELFCFGLLEQFDILQLAALCAPRPLRFVDPSDRVAREQAPLNAWYALHKSKHAPLE